MLYVPWLALGAAVTCLTWPSAASFIGLGVIAIGIAILFFFRDPPRTVPTDPLTIVAPADGAVRVIEDLLESPYFDGPCRRISIFMSLLDAHVNRAPFQGAVREVSYRPGEFKNALKTEAAACNEANVLRLDTDYGPVTVRQIAGILARRIVCRVGSGETLAKGEKFGMIRFGSQTELYLPPQAKIRVSVKEKVRAGSSIVAEFCSEDDLPSTRADE